MFRLAVLGFLVVQAQAVINRLTREEYETLPRFSKVDEYATCLHGPGDSYCFLTATLYGNLSDPLYNTLVEFSANTVTHYNRTKIHYGICPNQSCNEFMSISPNRTQAIEACLNATFTRDYRMTTKILDIICEDYKESVVWDRGDYAFGAMVLILLGLNILGSLYEFFCMHSRDTFVGKFLLCFAVRKNWRRLAAPPCPGVMQERIRVIYCFRTLTSVFVIFGHSPIPSLLTSVNTDYLEEAYHRPMYLFAFNGTLIVQVFFLLSSFLLTYNTILSEEKRPPVWLNLPKGLLLRWMRLTPPYAFVLFYVMTWQRHVADGPFNLLALVAESNDCHRDWWRHLLYIHNYKDQSQCMAHAWYLAADFQLTIVGLIVLCLIYSNKARKIVIWILLVVGLILPGIHTYVQNLHPILLFSPEVGLNFFVFDPTFNNLYKRGHTNLVCYALGMVLAYLVYNLKESEIGSLKYRKYRTLFWALFPIKFLVIFMGAVFYLDGIVVPLAVRVVYSGGIKLLYGFLTALFIFFTITKTDTVYRGFVNWSGWARLSRVTYLAYLIHVPLLRYAVANNYYQGVMTFFWFVQNYSSNLLMSFVLSVPLFLILEAPMAEVVKLTMVPAPRTKKEKPVSTLTSNSKEPSQQRLIEIKEEQKIPYKQ